MLLYYCNFLIISVLLKIPLVQNMFHELIDIAIVTKDIVNYILYTVGGKYF